MEQVANALSLVSKPLMIAQSPTDVQTYGSAGMTGHGWLFNPLALQDFTVDADRKLLCVALIFRTIERESWRNSALLRAPSTCFRFRLAHRILAVQSAAHEPCV